MNPTPRSRRSPWSWVPTLYLAEGLPYVLVIDVSVVLYKRFGISNTDIALATSLLYLPWVLKPIWSPVVDLVRTKRLWILMLQLGMALILLLVTFSLHLSSFFAATLILFWLLAVASATHDIAADGFYMLGLDDHDQAAYVGVRSTFYRGAWMAGRGGIVFLAGLLELRLHGGVPMAWSVAIGVAAVSLLGIFLYHTIALPRPDTDRSVSVLHPGEMLREVAHMLALFFKREGVAATLAFLLLFRLAEAQLVKIVTPFMLDPRGAGGLSLSTEEVGIAYGTVGVIALTLGGLLGGFVASRHGLKFWLWPMVAAIHIPDLVFVYLSQVQPSDFFTINVAVALEQFGYGFGFTAYVLVMLMISEGEHATVRYAICTGFMAMGMLLPGAFSGAVQEWLGYKGFFLWVMISTIPGFIVPALIRIDPKFGRKTA
jgi:PAT family beta-lactamase induction signal transducer AmpG